MINNIKKIEDFLKEDSKRAIDIYVQDGKKLALKMRAEDIETHGSLQNYLIGLKQNNQELQQVYIQKYLPNGMSGNTRNYKRHQEMPTPIRFEDKETSLGSEHETVKSVAVNPATPPVSATTQPVQVPAPPPPSTMYNGLGMNGAASGMAGIIEAHVNAQKYADLKEKHKELKEEYRELKADSKQTERELRTANSEIANFDKKLELEVKLIQNSLQKTFTPDVLKELLGTLTTLGPEIAKNMSASGMGSVEENLSSTKKDLISLIKDDRINDDQVLFYYYVIDKINKDVAFREELNQKINT